MKQHGGKVERALAIAHRRQAGGHVGGREWTGDLMRQQTTHDRLKSHEERMEVQQGRSNGAVEDSSAYYMMNPHEGTNPYNPGRERQLAYGGSAGVPKVPKPPGAESFAGGFINSAVPGRTDKLNMNVPSGSYVVPSSVVSHLGQDNSLAGAHVLDAMFETSNPQGGLSGKIRSKRAFRSGRARMKTQKASYAEGGMVEESPEVPVVVAGGEWVATPEMLIEKFGDLDTGHKIMDSFVEQARKKHIKTLRKLPGPVKD